MIRVTAPSRLHFGLFALPNQGVSHWLNSEGHATLPARHFGGVGLMIDQPGVRVTVRPAAQWSATGTSAERALQFAKRFAASMEEQEAYEVHVEQCAPGHAGLGAGTQLALAVARALAVATNHSGWDAIELARRVGRGLRSSLGVHGFQRGGLLVEGGKAAHTEIAPLLVRAPFPDDWHVLLLLPGNVQGAHGADERDAFDRLARHESSLRRTEMIARLVLLGVLPALIERDLPAFGESLYDLNRQAGEMFAHVQGGIYGNPRTADLIAALRELGIRGVGQSSWGPAVFAIEASEKLQHARDALVAAGRCRPEEALLCRACNQGATAT